MKTRDSLQAEIAYLRALLVQIEEPVAPSEVDGTLHCLWCSREESKTFGTGLYTINHDADCLWLAIRKERQP